MKTKTDLEGWLRQVRRCNDVLGWEAPDLNDKFRQAYSTLMRHIDLRRHKLHMQTGMSPDTIILGRLELETLKNYETMSDLMVARDPRASNPVVMVWQGMRIIPANDDSLIVLGYSTDI